MQAKVQLRPSTKTTGSGSPSHTLKKSRRNLREKSHQEFYNNRISKLTNIFSQQGYTLDQLVTEEEILKVLDSIGKEQYNRELATQLFEKIPSQGGARSSEKRKFVLQDFVDTHIKAEYFLLLHAEEVEDELEEIYNKVAIAKDELQAALNRPEEAVQTDSLRIDVVEVVCEDREYEADIGSVFSVILVVGDYKYETQEVVIEDTVFNPQFDWNFHFKLKDPDTTTVKVFLRDQKRHGRDENYSDLKCTFDLKNFMNKTTYDTYMALCNHFDQQTQFKVHLVLKWPPTRVETCENKIIEYQEKEQKVLEEKEYIENSIKKLVHPFACAAAALKAKKSSIGVRPESTSLMGKPYASEPAGDMMRPIDMFRSTSGQQELSKSHPNPNPEPIGYNRLSNESSQSGANSRFSAPYNAPENISNPMGNNTGGYVPAGFDMDTRSGVGYPLEAQKRSSELSRHSVESSGAKQQQQGMGRSEYSGGAGVQNYSRASVDSKYDSRKPSGGFQNPNMPQMGYTGQPGNVGSNMYMGGSTGSETNVRRMKP